MRKHNKKIYYSAGLISIILLPVFCLIYLKSIDAFTNYGSIDLYRWNGKDFKKETTQFLNSKKFKIVNLTGNIDSDRAKLNIAQKDIKKIISTKDSIKGIKFHFEKKSEYWSFIRVIEILQIEKAKVYLPYKNDIWFANPRTPKPNKNSKQIKSFVCGTQYTIYVDETESNIKWQEIIVVLKKYYLPIIAYILMIFFTFKRIMHERKGNR
ncbi:hypothetical protein [Flavobacterium succinicans]|jgi:uncharacterized protein YktA (UPF0223 family)|uniref:Uncharacterized protein n=1 Tax=Flavobacterium succinicans TaxID=29536 RepID=A0A199XRT3_9FLAO|nr:hypothetical protein [Flavobacterium succinicans]OAZ04127.1 hypothetical protein FLB_14830 [Flavobacterium succinicans]